MRFYVPALILNVSESLFTFFFILFVMFTVTLLCIVGKSAEMRIYGKGS